MPRRHRLSVLERNDPVPSLTASPHDFPERLGSQPSDGVGASVSPEELGPRFLNEATESDFPERLASEEHDRERDDLFAIDDPDAWEPEDVERLLHSAPTLTRLIEDVRNHTRAVRAR
jgi:hypothetical protein